MYDPRAYGARCDVCPLRTRRAGAPVPPEIRAGALALLIGANPGPEEVKRGQPFVGPAGLELMRAMASVGLSRSRVSISNAILCCPPGKPRGALERLNHELQKENKARERAQLPPIPTPMECCRPRLLNEVRAQPNVVALGGAAVQALSGRATGILEARGSPREGKILVDGAPVPVRMLPTLHPSFVMSARRWEGPFRADLSRAFRWFTSGLAWRDPQILYYPTPAQLAAFMERIAREPFSVFDVETYPGFPDAEHYDPCFDKLKCIGLGIAGGLACVVPFRSMEGAKFYAEEQKPQITALLREYFTSPKWKKAGWNSRYYDAQVIKAQLGVDIKPHFDAIGLSRLAAPELPHDLGFAGSIYTDVDDWKAGHVATEVKVDRLLWDYNAKDCVVTAMAVAPLAKVVKEREQIHLLPIFAKNQDTCVGLHRNGIFIDQVKRREWDRKLLWQANLQRKRIRDLSGRESLNPASFPQIADLLFEQLGIAPHHYSEKTAEPSTDDDSLRAFLSETWGLDEKRKKLIQAVRDFRRAGKRRGVVVRLRPISEPYYEEPFLVDLEETEEEREERMRRAAKGKGSYASGLVLPDGRVHADWNAGGTVGWRFSSKNPNCFDRETEVLTPRGWVKLPDLRLERVAQWEDGRVSFVDPIRITHRQFTGRMVTIRNQHIDLRVTADHRCLTRDRKTGALRVHTAENYPLDAHQLHGGVGAGTGLGLSEAEITVICAMQADGTWARGTPFRPWLRFSKRRKTERLRSALNTLGAVYSETVYGGKASFLIQDEHLISLLDRFLGRAKVFGPWVFDLAEHEAAFFVDEVFYWDGCFTRMNHYSSSVKVNADLVQAILALRGWRARQRVYMPPSGRPNYQVDVTRRDYSLTSNAEKKIEEVVNEEVYCLSVPSSYVIVRRGQNVMVTGQCQNLEDRLRDMFVAAPGHVFVACDEAQLELRMVAGLSKCAYYLEAFRKKGDPHKVLCVDTFGDQFLRASAEQQKRLRRSVKELTYSSLYWAGDETKLEIVTSAEDEDERLIFPDFTLREVHAFTDNWHRRCPEIAIWWESILEEWKRQHFLAEPILGLKCDFLDGEDRTKLVNYKPQSGGAALTHLATFRALAEIPFEKWGPGTGLVQQGHDSLVFEVPADHVPWKTEVDPKSGKVKETWCAPDCTCRASRVARLLEECMKEDGRKYGLDVDFEGEAKIGRTWKSV